MESKIFELRDRGTFVPVLCIRLNTPYEAEIYLLGRSGFQSSKRPNDFIIMCGLEGGKATYDPYQWGDNRTRIYAHQHIIDNWKTLKPGQVIDVEYILGETPEPKISERFTNHKTPTDESRPKET